MEETDLAHKRRIGVDLANHEFFQGKNVGKVKKGKLADVMERMGGDPEDLIPPENIIHEEVEDGHIVGVVRTANNAANNYDAYNVFVGRVADGEIVQILPLDSIRTRALITNNDPTNAVYIGKMTSGLGNQDGGYKLPVGSPPLEIATTARVFGTVQTSAGAGARAQISVWIERDE
jgi:hypothetical protein